MKFGLGCCYMQFSPFNEGDDLGQNIPKHGTPISNFYKVSCVFFFGITVSVCPCLVNATLL